MARPPQNYVNTNNLHTNLITNCLFCITYKIQNASIFATIYAKNSNLTCLTEAFDLIKDYGLLKREKNERC